MSEPPLAEIPLPKNLPDISRSPTIDGYRRVSISDYHDPQKFLKLEWMQVLPAFDFQKNRPDLLVSTAGPDTEASDREDTVGQTMGETMEDDIEETMGDAVEETTGETVEDPVEEAVEIAVEETVEEEDATPELGFGASGSYPSPSLSITPESTEVPTRESFDQPWTELAAAAANIKHPLPLSIATELTDALTDAEIEFCSKLRMKPEKYTDVKKRMFKKFCDLGPTDNWSPSQAQLIKGINANSISHMWKWYNELGLWDDR